MSLATSPFYRVEKADYANPEHAAALVYLLDAYASDPMGGGHPLNDFARSNLVAALSARPEAFSVLAFDGGVVPAYRGRRVAEKMLGLVAQIALSRGACKLTLEVLQGNQAAVKLYERIGFSHYQLDPAMGQAQFFQKWLS